MYALEKVLMVLGGVLVVLAAFLIVGGMASVWYIQGGAAFRYMMSPSNIANWFLMAATLAPGTLMLMGALKLGSKRLLQGA